MNEYVCGERPTGIVWLHLPLPTRGVWFRQAKRPNAEKGNETTYNVSRLVCQQNISLRPVRYFVRRTYIGNYGNDTCSPSLLTARLPYRCRVLWGEVDNIYFALAPATGMCTECAPRAV